MTNQTVWAIDDRSAKYYHLETIDGSSTLGRYDAAPVTIVRGTHQVMEWRVWTNLDNAPVPDGIPSTGHKVHVGYVQIHPNSVPGAIRFRIKTIGQNDWNKHSYPTLHHACEMLQAHHALRMSIHECNAQA